jgi:hypothetical protein
MSASKPHTIVKCGIVRLGDHRALAGNRIGGCSDSLDNIEVVATVESDGGESHSAWRLQPP